MHDDSENTYPGSTHVVHERFSAFSGSTHVVHETLFPSALVEDGNLISIDIAARSLVIVGRKEQHLDSIAVESVLIERKKKRSPVPSANTRREF